LRSHLTRRELLLRLGASGAALGASAGISRLCYDPGTLSLRELRDSPLIRDFRALHPGPAMTPTVVVARSSHDPAELTRRAIAALGGMTRFISRGDIVALKPNIGWDRLPIHAANTNPLVVAELVRLAFDAGAKQVVVTDASCNEPNRCFQRSGIWRAAHDLGATVILPAEHRFREMRLGGEILDRWPVYLPLIHADKVINVPIAKHHNLSKFTGGLKNWYGILGGRRNRLHQSIDVSIADLATFMRPTLTVMDATRVLIRNGPQGGNIDDAKDMHQVIAGLDPVAIDAYGAGLVGIPIDQIAYLRLAQTRGLGQSDLAATSIAFV
jgi:uncharacterized protein (DUF362 family)